MPWPAAMSKPIGTPWHTTPGCWSTSSTACPAGPGISRRHSASGRGSSSRRTGPGSTPSARRSLRKPFGPTSNRCCSCRSWKRPTASTPRPACRWPTSSPGHPGRSTTSNFGCPRCCRAPRRAAARPSVPTPSTPPATHPPTSPTSIHPTTSIPIWETITSGSRSSAGTSPRSTVSPASGPGLVQQRGLARPPGTGGHPRRALRRAGARGDGRH